MILFFFISKKVEHDICEQGYKLSHFIMKNSFQYLKMKKIVLLYLLKLKKKLFYLCN